MNDYGLSVERSSIIETAEFIKCLNVVAVKVHNSWQNSSLENKRCVNCGYPWAIDERR